ncbi:class GN sortase [bacterium SCSIO 12696]|nr:class GN sortase [bacterium SCSIO 12696]
MGRSRALLRRYWVPLLLLVVGLFCALNGGYIHAKAVVGQWLIERAWQQSLATGKPSKPWSWADTWPVGQLQIPALGVDQVILAGDSGQALAFGPGHNPQSASPGGPGVVIISGHRDTHFRFLAALEPGDTILLAGSGGQQRYRMVDEQVVDTRNGQLFLNNVANDQLILVTCWPLGGIQQNTPWRYLVFAEPLIEEVT